MATYCPNCNKPRPAALACPLCGGPLTSGEPRQEFGWICVWMRSPFGRVLIGLLLAQGLFHAVQQIATGILLASIGSEPLASFNASLGGVVFWQVLQCLTLLVGAAVAGSSDSFGFFYGNLVGIGNGVLSTAFPLVPGMASSDLALYGQTLIQASIGLVGGWMGGILWRPPFEFQLSTGLSDVRKEARRPRKPLLTGPIYWPRVLFGASIAIIGSLSAGYLFDTLLEAGRGRLASGSYLQDQIFTWEIKALTLLLAGTLAGANTSNGFKQGLIVGVIAALILAALPVSSAPTHSLIQFLVTLSLCTLGGWFGGQLLPPILVRRKSKYTGPMA